MTNSEIKLVSQFAEGFPLLTYFRPHEFLFRGGSNAKGSCKNKNTLPPRSIWKNIYDVATVWDEVRHTLGQPIKVLSVYRNEDYNSCIGGAANSFHKKGMACDATSSKVPAKELYAVALKLRRAGYFKGGLGLYTASNFVHLDVRGTNYSWGN